jgi:hypothetical protein
LALPVAAPDKGGPGRGDGVDRVGLAVAVAGLAIGPIDLDHLDARGAQEPGQPRSIRARALDPDPHDFTKAGQPGEQLGVALARHRERLDTQQATVAVHRRRHMSVEVGVDPAADRTRLYHGHMCHPFSSSCARGGTYLPGRRT